MKKKYQFACEKCVFSPSRLCIFSIIQVKDQLFVKCIVFSSRFPENVKEGLENSQTCNLETRNEVTHTENTAKQKPIHSLD